jgi:hypothetical protein
MKEDIFPCYKSLSSTILSYDSVGQLPTCLYFLLLQLHLREFKLTCGLFHVGYMPKDGVYLTDGGTMPHNMHLQLTRELSYPRQEFERK